MHCMWWRESVPQHRIRNQQRTQCRTGVHRRRCEWFSSQVTRQELLAELRLGFGLPVLRRDMVRQVGQIAICHRCAVALAALFASNQMNIVCRLQFAIVSLTWRQTDTQRNETKMHMQRTSHSRISIRIAIRSYKMYDNCKNEWRQRRTRCMSHDSVINFNLLFLLRMGCCIESASAAYLPDDAIRNFSAAIAISGRFTECISFFVVELINYFCSSISGWNLTDTGAHTISIDSVWTEYIQFMDWSRWFWCVRIAFNV